MRIVIKSAEVTSREIPNATTGRSFIARSQAAILRGSEEVKKFALPLSDGVVSYDPGEYELSSESFTVDAYGRLALARSLKLEKVVGK